MKKQQFYINIFLSRHSRERGNLADPPRRAGARSERAWIPGLPPGMTNGNMNRGNALITLLFFMFIGITILTSTGLVLYNSIFGASQVEQGQMAYYAAESGVENAILSRLRNPLYSGGTFAVGNGSATISISGDIITSTGTFGNAVRKIEVRTTSSSGALSVTSWKEIQ